MKAIAPRPRLAGASIAAGPAPATVLAPSVHALDAPGTARRIPGRRAQGQGALHDLEHGRGRGARDALDPSEAIGEELEQLRVGAEHRADEDVAPAGGDADEVHLRLLGELAGHCRDPRRLPLDLDDR